MRLLQNVLPGLSQTKQPQRKFLTHLLGLLLMLPGHATFRNLSRYSSYDERTFSRWYAKEFDFVSLNKAAITHVTPSEHEQALVIDASFVPKSGKKTYGLDRFWNGSHGRSEKGLEVLAALRRYAPMWLAQLPGLVSEVELERLQRQVQGATAARMLRELAEAELMVWPDGTRAGGYRFQHALYQQVLYEQLGIARRMQLHQRIGARLEAGYGARAGEIAPQLAVHFERGGETSQAVHYWQEAADTAAQRNAHTEAIAALRKGLVLLATLPEDPERTQRELALQLTLGELLSMVRGRMAPEVGEAYTRAYALCQQVGETPWRFEALWGLTLCHCVEAQLGTASSFSQELFDLAQCQHDAVLMQRSHYALGMYAFAQGHFGAARAHLEDRRRLGDTPQRSTPIFFHGVSDQGMNALCFLAQVLWGLGSADQAQQWSQEARAMVQQGESPPAGAQVQVLAAALCQCRRDAVATHAHAEALRALAEAQGFGLRCEQGRLLRGWALALPGRPAEGVAQIRQAFAVYPNLGPGLFRSYFLGLFAEG